MTAPKPANGTSNIENVDQLITLSDNNANTNSIISGTIIPISSCNPVALIIFFKTLGNALTAPPHVVLVNSKGVVPTVI